VLKIYVSLILESLYQSGGAVAALATNPRFLPTGSAKSLSYSESGDFRTLGLGMEVLPTVLKLEYRSLPPE
jgi:hypothetical protein